MKKILPITDCCSLPDWRFVIAGTPWEKMQLIRQREAERPGEFISMLIEAKGVARCLTCSAVYLPTKELE